MGVIKEIEESTPYLAACEFNNQKKDGIILTRDINISNIIAFEKNIESEEILSSREDSINKVNRLAEIQQKKYCYTN